MNNVTKKPFLPVTDSGPKPGALSTQIQGVARGCPDTCWTKGNHLQRVEIILSPGMTAAEPSATPWLESVFSGGPLGGKLVRTLSAPDGMSADEARRIVDHEV